MILYPVESAAQDDGLRVQFLKNQVYLPSFKRLQLGSFSRLPVTLIVSRPHTLRVSTEVKVISSTTFPVLFILFSSKNGM